MNISYGIESEENEERDGGHAPSLPLLERDSTVVIVIYFRHHLLKDLKEEKKKKRMYDPLRIIVIYWKMPKGYIYICNVESDLRVSAQTRPSRGIRQRPSFD